MTDTPDEFTTINPLEDGSPWVFMGSRFETPKFLTEWLDEQMEVLVSSLPEDSPARQLWESLPKPPKPEVEATSGSPYTIDSVFDFRPAWWWAL